MKALLKLGLSSTILFSLHATAAFRPNMPVATQEDSLIHKAYVYAVQPRAEVNWVYIGMSPGCRIRPALKSSCRRRATRSARH